jgi:hypothetical protein
MAIDPEFEEMMNDIVTFRAGTAIDNYGRRTYGTSFTVRGRLMYEDYLTRGESDREATARGKFLSYGPALNLATTDEMILPDGVVGIIHSIDQMSDEQGDHHTVVNFGRSSGGRMGR